jgi:hypothetical protein
MEKSGSGLHSIFEGWSWKIQMSKIPAAVALRQPPPEDCNGSLICLFSKLTDSRLPRVPRASPSVQGPSSIHSSLTTRSPANTPCYDMDHGQAQSAISALPARSQIQSILHNI